MADSDKPRPSTVSDSPADPELKPERVPTATEEVNPANDDRSLDIGESGQFAPGGYYNQHGITEAERLDLDEFTATRDEKSGLITNLKPESSRK